jgi:hypothetical protein
MQKIMESFADGSTGVTIRPVDGFGKKCPSKLAASRVRLSKWHPPRLIALSGDEL